MLNFLWQRLRGAAGRGLLLLILLFILLPVVTGARQYYVATTGSDSNPGTADLPFLTIARAMSLSSTVFLPGDTITVRGGTYPATVTISISKNGTGSARYHLLAYPGERTLLDFSAMAVGSSNRGVNLKGNYWYVRGLDIKGAGDNGMIVSGSNNIIEFCSFFENRDTGLQLAGGASLNQVVNCDSYANADPDHGDADGFAPKLDVGTGNSFFGCRAWQNSDDGWDGYLRGADDVTTTLESCWCFSNGYLKDGSVSAGNGNGYKTGGSDLKDLKHNVVLKRCLAFDNRVKGFDQNNNRGSITIYHGTAYRNGTNYGLGDTLAFASGKVLTIANSVALGERGNLHSAAVQHTNSWMSPFTPPSASDFMSIDTTGVRGPRKSDGSLPDLLFLFPAASSQLVNAGTDVGLPFNGPAPDLGAFETAAPSAVAGDGRTGPREFRLMQNYPNPFNASTTLTYALSLSADVTLEILDGVGRVIRTLERGPRAAGVYRCVWDGNDARHTPVASGVYHVRLSAGGRTGVIRIVMVR
jgi:hypothetical protein